MLRLVLLSIAAFAVQGISYDGYRTITVGPLETTEQAAFVNSLRDEADFSRKVIILTDYFLRGRNVDLIVAPDSWMKVQEVLDLAEIPHSIVDEDAQKYIDNVRALNEEAKRASKSRNTNSKAPDYPDYYQTYDDEMVPWLETAAADSDIATLVSAGQSHEGRDVYYMEVNGGTNLPHVWLDGGHHAREWVAHATVIWIIYDLLYGTSAESERMRTDYRWSIMPMVNPDGYEFTWSNDRLWRKNRQPNSGSICVGTDLNRNYDANFGACGVSDNVCDDTYPGTAGFSAPETQNVRDAVLAQAADTDLLYSLHCYSQLWLVPWGGSNQKPADFNDLESAANAAAAAAEAVDGRSFEVGTPPDILYCAAGGTFDWAKDGNPDDMDGDGAGIKYAYTPELRPASAAGGGFDIPPSNIEPSGQEIWAGIIATIDQIALQEA